MYAKTCSQPKATPTTKEEPPNQAHTRKPHTDTQKSPRTQDNANQPKQSCIHTTAPKDPHVDSHPRQHTITLLSTQQPSFRALKKIPMCQHKKQGHTHPNQSCADCQTAKWKTPHRHRKSMKNCRTDTAPLRPAHTILCTQRPPRAHTEPPASPRQELLFSQECHSSVKKMF